jgi:small subunit ribosomal protein S24e
MELEIVSKKDNPLLDRTELEVLAHHTGQPTPTRNEVREHVAMAMKAKKDVVLVDHMESTFGKGLTRGYVKVYKTKEAAMAIEREPIKRRNEGGAKAPPPKKEEKVAEPEPEPAAEPTEGETEAKDEPEPEAAKAKAEPEPEAAKAKAEPEPEAAKAKDEPEPEAEPAPEAEEKKEE